MLIQLDMPQLTKVELSRLLGVSRQYLTQLSADPTFPASADGRSYDLIAFRAFLRRRALTRRERRGRSRPEQPPHICLTCGRDL